MTESDYEKLLKEIFPNVKLYIEYNLYFIYAIREEGFDGVSLVLTCSSSKNHIWEQAYNKYISDKESNKDRYRSYGLRVGDEVEVNGWGLGNRKAKVIARSGMDNNRVICQNLETGKYSYEVAEWCKIVKPVED